jgi:hypothetical protein
VSKLIELKLLDVYFTNDARQYVTPAKLTQEIQDELYLAGGTKCQDSNSVFIKTHFQSFIIKDSPKTLDSAVDYRCGEG